MPTDQHGVTHAGALGLYDDADETMAADQRLERHQREHLGTVIRREQRRVRRQHRKEANTPKSEAEGRSVLLRPRSWLEKALHREHHSRIESSPLKLGEEDGTGGDKKPAKGQIKVTTEYVVVRRPATPEPTYTAEDIDPIDSPWLRECGMVRVKSDDCGGCHIVPKNSIHKNN
ncbi:hypothetical protein FB567DRAFT_593800 [Paraphoma chrysanthemicola]|uniref:Uncharacterized protein n=1 Tax=Paraphoma chrysanthemicola TaxID=798071 RepID=A0A8K0R5C7_9PLEO|nr:hypothetical protein FB567DRAFT_593800 [Paraphoma chrysanthemicola]